MFVKIGNRVINLNNVTFVEYGRHDDKPCISVYFVGVDWPVRFYPETPGHYELSTWMDEQQMLLHD